MRKTILLLPFAGVFALTSCSSDPNEEAAEALCACFETNYEDVNIEELEAELEALENGTFDVDAEMAKEDQCVEDWKAKHNISPDNIDFRVALKNRSNSVYREAVDRGLVE